MTILLYAERIRNANFKKLFLPQQFQSIRSRILKNKSFSPWKKSADIKEENKKHLTLSDFFRKKEKSTPQHYQDIPNNDIKCLEEKELT